MGNTNYHSDPDWMLQYIHEQKQFRKDAPLFDVKDIRFPLRTQGTCIVDRSGKRVKLAGANWSGGHAARHCVGGLDRRHIDELCAQIRDEFGFNCIRLTFSLQLFIDDNVIDEKLISANPQFLGMKASQVFDATVKAITDAGLMVFLNNHTSKSMWCCSTSDGDGLWFTKEYSEEVFFDTLDHLTDRYKNNERVIGMDLRNQIRKSDQGSPTWGDGSKTDWKKAAQTSGNRILKIAPHWLIIVGGIDYQLDLTGVKQHPVKLSAPNKLVYSGHFYGFSWGPGVMWSLMSEEWFRQKLFNQQLYLRALGVPFLLGEFGSNERDKPWQYLMRILRELDLDWTYWCLDGYKCDEQEDETYGVWDYEFKQARYPDLLADLKKVARPQRGIQL